MIAVALAAGVSLPLILAIFAGQPAPDDVYWDALMAVGFISAGGIALLPVITARGAARIEPSAPVVRSGFELHELLSYVFVAGVIVHSLGLIIYQPIQLST